MTKTLARIVPCASCGARMRADSAKCRACGHWNTDEFTTRGMALETLDQVQDEVVDRLDCGPWGYCFGGGIAIATSTLIGGSPGGGKSTLLLHLIEALDCSIAYFGSEEKNIRVRQRAERLGVRLERQKATTMVKMTTGEVPDIQEVVKRHKVCFLDSLNMLIEDPTQAVAFVTMLSKMCERFGVTWIVTSHVTKGGDIAGFNSLQHAVDCTMLMFPEAPDPNAPRVLTVEKNRNGMAFIAQKYAMTAAGLVIVTNEGPTEQEETDVNQETSVD